MVYFCLWIIYGGEWIYIAVCICSASLQYPSRITHTSPLVVYVSLWKRQQALNQSDMPFTVWCFMYCHYIGTFTGSLVYLRFTSHWSASKKSSVMTLCIKVAKQIIFFVPKISVIQAVSASSFFSLLLFFSSSLPSFLHFFLAFIFLSNRRTMRTKHSIFKIALVLTKVICNYSDNYSLLNAIRVLQNIIKELL